MECMTKRGETLTDIYFILYLFPLFLIVWHLLRRRQLHRLSLCFLLLFSLFFYGQTQPVFCLWMTGSGIFTYGFSLLIRRSTNARSKRCFLMLGLIGNIGLLFILKYYNFLMGSLSTLFSWQSTLPRLSILVPVGVSFYTFRQIAYLVDTHRDTTGETRCSPLEYAASLAFFPIVLSGPIALHTALIPQFREKTNMTMQRLSAGIMLFSMGMGMKLLLAEPLGAMASDGYSSTTATFGISFFSMICYSLQIFFDFAGYSAMAQGVSRMIGFEIPANFNRPYSALSIGDFWKRWHITLTQFLTRYIYIPLGGNRKGRSRQMINIFLIFLISGLWHGAGWTFLVWGALHGIASILDKALQKPWGRIPKLIRWACTFATVSLFWVFFRAQSIDQALHLLGGLKTLRLEIPVSFWAAGQPMFFNTIVQFSSWFTLRLGTLQRFWGLLLIGVGVFLAIVPSDTETLSLRVAKKPIFCGVLCAFILFFSILASSNVVNFIYEGF